MLQDTFNNYLTHMFSDNYIDPQILILTMCVKSEWVFSVTISTLHFGCTLGWQPFPRQAEPHPSAAANRAAPPSPPPRATPSPPHAPQTGSGSAKPAGRSPDDTLCTCAEDHQKLHHVSLGFMKLSVTRREWWKFSCFLFIKIKRM